MNRIYVSEDGKARLEIIDNEYAEFSVIFNSQLRDFPNFTADKYEVNFSSCHSTDIELGYLITEIMQMQKEIGDRNYDDVESGFIHRFAHITGEKLVKVYSNRGEK